MEFTFFCELKIHGWRRNASHSVRCEDVKNKKKIKKKTSDDITCFQSVYVGFFRRQFNGNIHLGYVFLGKKNAYLRQDFVKASILTSWYFFSFNLIQNKTTDKIEFALSFIPLKNC